MDVQVFGKRVSVSPPSSSSRRRIAGPPVATAGHDMISHHNGDGVDLGTYPWSSLDSGDISDNHDLNNGGGDENVGDTRDNQYNNDDEDEDTEDDDDDGDDTSGDDQETEEEHYLEDDSFSGPSGTYSVDERDDQGYDGGDDEGGQRVFEEKGTETFSEGDDEGDDYPRHHRQNSAVSFDSAGIAPSAAGARRW